MPKLKLAPIGTALVVGAIPVVHANDPTPRPIRTSARTADLRYDRRHARRALTPKPRDVTSPGTAGRHKSHSVMPALAGFPSPDVAIDP